MLNSILWYHSAPHHFCLLKHSDRRFMQWGMVTQDLSGEFPFLILIWFQSICLSDGIIVFVTITAFETFSPLKLWTFRFEDDVELAKLPSVNGVGVVKFKYKIDGTQVQETSTKRTDKELPGKSGKSLKAKVLSRVFSEDYERVKKKILDPRGPTIRRWNKIFLITCLISLFVDPLFFYLPEVKDQVCIDIGIPLEVVLTILRSVADVFYIIQIYIRFRKAYIAPSSRVFGRGELVIDSSKIALRYLRFGFWIDLIAALPLPQVCYSSLVLVLVLLR